MRRIAPLLVLLLLAGALAAGCGAGAGGGGGDEFSGEEARVAETIDGLGEAAQARDERRICGALLAPVLARRLGDCQRQIGGVLDDADSYDLEVEEVRLLARDRARARVQSGRDEEADRIIELTRGPQAWQIASLGSGRAAPAPAG